MDKVTPRKNEATQYESNAFSKRAATLNIPLGSDVTSNGVDMVKSGVPKAVKFGADWDNKVTEIVFYASFDDVVPGPGQDLADVMELVRDSAGLAITMSAVAGQTHLVPMEARRFLSAFNYCAVCGNLNHAANATTVELFLAADLS